MHKYLTQIQTDEIVTQRLSYPEESGDIFCSRMPFSLIIYQEKYNISH